MTDLGLRLLIACSLCFSLELSGVCPPCSPGSFPLKTKKGGAVRCLLSDNSFNMDVMILLTCFGIANHLFAGVHVDFYATVLCLSLLGRVVGYGISLAQTFN